MTPHDTAYWLLMLLVYAFVLAGFWWMDRTDREMHRKQNEIWDRLEEELDADRRRINAER